MASLAFGGRRIYLGHDATYGIIIPMSSKFSKRGQALVESLVAVSLLTVGFLAIFSLLSRSLSLNRASTQSYIGTYLAAEGIEVIRSMVDANGLQKRAWNDGFATGDYEVEYSSQSLAAYSDPGRKLKFNPSNNTYDYGGSVDTDFIRKISVQSFGPDELVVNSEVFWRTGSKQSSINLEDVFFNWRP